MDYRRKDIGSLREAARRCRARAEAVDGGFAALSYAQLADEIDSMIVVRKAAIAAERAATADAKADHPLQVT